MRRLALLLPAAILAALASLAPRGAGRARLRRRGLAHAALVVEHGDGSVVTRCVAFDASSVSGEELLDRSGVAWSSQTFGGFGDAVCALDGEPARYVDCPGKDSYWAVFVARGGGLVAARQRGHLDPRAARRRRRRLPLRARFGGSGGAGFGRRRVRGRGDA